MKKILLIPALLSTLAFSADYKYEISPVIGFDLAEGNLGIQHDISNGGYATYGLEVQANSEDSKLSPELSVFYSHGIDYLNENTRMLRGAFNGVYTFDNQDAITPFVKAGVGYEKVTTEITDNESGFFLDAGAGVKIALMDQLALKLEAIYMAKPGTNNSGFADSNLLTMAGLTYSFGAMAQKPAPVVAPAPKPEPVVAKPAPVVAPVIVDNDTDKDGVVNAKDECPNTPAGTAVNKYGCADKVALQINFKTDSFEVTPDSNTELQTYANFLTLHTNYDAKITGYTDSRGSEAYNQKLSENRANAVVAELKKRGVNAKQLSAVGKGESNPVASNMTAEGRAANRRIEAELIKR